MTRVPADRLDHAAVGRVSLYWIPLGSGGHVVRWNGRIYEAISAAIQRRERLDIYHSALVVDTGAGPVTVEMTPVPDADGAARGVVAEGAVGARWAARFRLFRYEVRRWLGGVIPDLGYAVASPVVLGADARVATAVLEALPLVPRLTWGRDEAGAGEMWSCNSIISWTLATAGVDVKAIALPHRGRAPGWDAGLAVAEGAAGAAARFSRRRASRSLLRA